MWHERGFFAFFGGIVVVIGIVFYLRLHEPNRYVAGLIALVALGVIVFATGLREMHNNALDTGVPDIQIAGLRYVFVFAFLFGIIAMFLIWLALNAASNLQEATSDVARGLAVAIIAGLLTGLVIAVLAPYLSDIYARRYIGNPEKLKAEAWARRRSPKE